MKIELSIRKVDETIFRPQFAIGNEIFYLEELPGHRAAVWELKKLRHSLEKLGKYQKELTVIIKDVN